ncbi:hypothetical protein BGZ96_003471 [Linnemannia gamsii]|uniref:glucan 1,3-beta-glucosidase n=1 Tax=Linnemannia gamsii TaxID=64522 RepID=A0ABQ7K7J5_9FUNG|nr:hypothetical protein BGZ96_003471 [Linnemannia gamsii]
MSPPRKDERSCFRRHRCIILLIIFLVIAAAVAVPLVLLKPWHKNNKNNPITGSGRAKPNLITPGTTITPSTDNSAQPNSYTPPLNQPLDYANGTVKMRGVNLGGWLVLEPFITPSLFDPYVKDGIVDEWTLCEHLGPDASRKLLEDHYASWVTEDTFVQIKKLGLNHVRVPIGFWAMGNLVQGEPYVANVSWNYLLRAIEWARKHGIRVMVELHGAPGSQNGWNHSGRVGQIRWVNGTDGALNAERTLPYLRQMATFFSNPAYTHVSPVMGMLNEPAGFLIGGEAVVNWYKQAVAAVRQATGPGKGPWAVLHDGFLSIDAFGGFKAQTDRLMMDSHLYIMFTDGLMSLNQTAQLKFACQSWGTLVTTSTKTFGPTMVGEFSVAVNDCATYLNGVNVGARWDGTFATSTYRHSPDSTCDGKNDALTYTDEYKTFLKQFFLAQIEAYEQGAGWFYWNFKTETNPLWSYFDGVEGGWLPEDANRGPGYCASMGYSVNLPQVVDESG